MDESIRHFNPNPLPKANSLSKLFFWWLNPIFSKGYKRRLEVEDMYNVTDQDSSELLGNRLEKEWKKELDKLNHDGKPSLLRALCRMFGFRYFLLGFIVFIEEGTKIAQPLLLGQLIRFFTPNSPVTSTDAYLFAMGVSISAIMLAVVHHPYFFTVQRIGMQMRVACCSLLYRKSLRLSNTALGQTTTGQIVNLMSNDVSRFDTAAIFLHYLWVGPAQAIPVLIILWYELGPSTLAGFAVLLFLVPVQSWMGKLFSKLRRKTAIHTDERVKIMNEMISGMRVIKMYCWEKPFGKLIATVRRLEKIYVLKTKTLWAISYTVTGLGHLLMYLVFVAVTSVLGIPLYADKLYLCINFFKLIWWNFVQRYNILALRESEAYVSTLRIQNFLLLDELESDHLSEASGLRPKPENCFVNIENVTAVWDEEVEQSTLENINVKVTAGKLLAVIGPVGAGKSSLLMSILRELPVSSGNVKVQGKIAYVSQQPWVFSASLRQNILFGNKYDRDRYSKILKACALNKDIELMPLGDATLIGDRGVSLSGGQRARVSLARALYMEADVYLLDDPLSAVDAAVGRHLFDKVIQKMLRNKPRILVTHQLHFLKEADEILILKEGKCLGQGTFEEMSTSGVDFSALLKPNKEEEEKPKAKVVPHQEPSYYSSNPQIGSTFSLTSVGTEFEPDPIQLPEEEERSEGTVGWRVYYEYFKSGAGPFKFILLVLLNLLAQTTYVMSDWWLSVWANQEEAKFAAVQLDTELRATGLNSTNVTIPYVDTDCNIYVFTGIIVAVFLFGLLRALMFFKVLVDASMHLHNKMFSRLLRVPIRFFDVNPVGRILNRFSKDTGHMDDQLPVTFFDFTQCFLLILGIIIVVCVVIPWIFLPLVPICILFFVTRRYYITTSRHIKRLEGTTRSPVFSHLSASLQGLHTIRAFGVSDKFMEEFDSHQNLHTESWFLFLSTSRWLAVRLDWMCAIFVTAVSFSCVLAASGLNGGLVGLSMTYAMTLMGMFQWAVRQSAEVENQMISVERVLEYSKLDTEAELESDKSLPPDWPQSGAITAENARIRYAKELPWVFRGLNFSIKGKEKIGIVGRTGAGKSSLISLMFRTVEPEGTVIIDGVNVLNIGLHELRNKISIIPQDPVLFTGSLRKNLDPFGELPDSSLWKALEEVQLKSAVDDLPGQLDSEVSEGGTNFSVGQRQLICLARAILRHNKILMIDEATANVDPRTDSLIQKTIRTKFKECTVLTIAHRLNTIMDSDRVMVLDEGDVVEFNHPHKLLQDKNGFFYKMVQQTGTEGSKELFKIAADSYTSSVLEKDTMSDDADKQILVNGYDSAVNDIHKNAIDNKRTLSEGSHIEKGENSVRSDMEENDREDMGKEEDSASSDDELLPTGDKIHNNDPVTFQSESGKNSVDENLSDNSEKDDNGTTDKEEDGNHSDDELLPGHKKGTEETPSRHSEEPQSENGVTSPDGCEEMDTLLSPNKNDASD